MRWVVPQRLLKGSVPRRKSIRRIPATIAYLSTSEVATVTTEYFDQDGSKPV